MPAMLKGIVCLFDKSKTLIKSQLNSHLPVIQCRHKSLETPFTGLKNHWPKYRMMRDNRRRMVYKEWGAAKMRVDIVRKCKFLPPLLQSIAETEFHNCPKSATRLRCENMCQLTGKLWRNVNRYKLGRMVFRHLADYNKLAGVQRAFWKRAENHVPLELPVPKSTKITEESFK